MKIKWNRLFSAALVLGLMLCFALTAYAHAAPDLTRRGSITITVQDGGDGIPGGTLTLYRVGEVAEDNGSYYFVPTANFAGCGESFENLEASTELAERLTEYASANQIVGIATREIGADGTILFSDLELGLYLLVQDEAAAGYEKLAPWLVSVPYLWNEEYLYDVSANPKTELEKEPEPTEPEPTEPPKLPQTGQLWWPVPVLACGGLMLLALGTAWNRRREANES